MTPDQCRMARRRLRWSATELGTRVGLHPSTITNFETGRKNLRPENLARVQLALLEAGVDVDDLCAV